MIIHGRSKDWVKLKDYLTKDLEIPEPIIMGEQFGLGRTLPEKFEYLASRVDGVIAIATSDDIGGLAIDQNEENIPIEKVRLDRRARQNVWLEVGWGWGHFGRKNIMILRKGDIEAITPSTRDARYSNFSGNVLPNPNCSPIMIGSGISKSFVK